MRDNSRIFALQHNYKFYEREFKSFQFIAWADFCLLWLCCNATFSPSIFFSHLNSCNK